MKRGAPGDQQKIVNSVEKVPIRPCLCREAQLNVRALPQGFAQTVLK
jgi:hypothetical protein